MNLILVLILVGAVVFAFSISQIMGTRGKNTRIEARAERKACRVMCGNPLIKGKRYFSCVEKHCV